MITVRGRVRPTVRLKQDGDGAGCVVVTSWASDRAFPRTAGAGVTFELETDAGEVVKIDPFEALVTVPVRWRTREGGTAHERGWLAVGDEVSVDGERDGDLVRAARVAGGGAGVEDGEGVHRVPPRLLAAGEEARDEVVTAEAAPPASMAPPRARGRKNRRAPLPNPLPAQRGEGEEDTDLVAPPQVKT